MRIKLFAFGLLLVGFYCGFNYSAIVKWINSPPWYLSEVALKINERLDEDEWTLTKKGNITNGKIVISQLNGNKNCPPYGFTIWINDCPVSNLEGGETQYLYRKAYRIYQAILTEKALKLLEE